MYFLPVIIISILFGLFAPGTSDAYIWRCHTPQGDIWTEQPNGNADCQEYDGMYNPSAAPLPVQSYPPQYAPQPALPPVVVLPPPVVYAPYPYPYYPPPYYYYPGPRVYVGPPLFGFRFNFGGHVGHGGRHFGGHRR